MPIERLDDSLTRPDHLDRSLTRTLRENGQSLALQHAVHDFSQWAPIVLPTTFLQLVLIDEEDVVLEARVEMRLKA